MFGQTLDPSTVPEELDFSDSGTGVLSAETELESSPHAAKVKRVAAKVACAIVLIFIISFPFHVSFFVLPRLIKSPYKIYFLNIPYFMRVRKRFDAEKIRKIG